VRDNASHLRVYSLTERAADALEVVADIVLPEGSGMGPLALDPEVGLAYPTPMEERSDQCVVGSDRGGRPRLAPI
jgi:hypothetical protein